MKQTYPTDRCRRETKDRPCDNSWLRQQFQDARQNRPIEETGVLCEEHTIEDHSEYMEKWRDE